MRFPRFFIAVAMLVLSAQSAFSQSTNADDCGNGLAVPLTQASNSDPDRFVGVCHLENSSTSFTYDDSPDYQGDVQFTVRSCFTHWGETCDNPVPYTVVISGESNGSSFILRRNSGQGSPQTAEIGLTYSSGGMSHQIPPDTEVPDPSPPGDGPVALMFPGGANGLQRPATITMSLASSANLRPGVYSGTFYLSIYQCGSLGPNGWGSACNGQYSYTYLENVPFHIELHQNSTIRISGLEDMALSINPGSGATGSQIFCVESSGGALFRITADSASGSGQFQLQGIDQLEYSARVEHLPSGRSEDLPEGQVSSSTWPGHSDSQCQNLAQENMQITVNVSQAELEQAQSSSYADTLTLTVELE